MKWAWGLACKNGRMRWQCCKNGKGRGGKEKTLIPEACQFFPDEISCGRRKERERPNFKNCCIPSTSLKSAALLSCIVVAKIWKKCLQIPDFRDWIFWMCRSFQVYHSKARKWDQNPFGRAKWNKCKAQCFREFSKLMICEDFKTPLKNTYYHIVTTEKKRGRKLQIRQMRRYLHILPLIWHYEVILAIEKERSKSSWSYPDE